MGLVDLINKAIDWSLIKTGRADPSIKTNGQVLELMRVGLISNDTNDIESFLQKAGNDYNPAILEARDEFASYLDALSEGNREKSDEMREKIEEKMKASDQNVEGMTFTRIIDSVSQASKGEIAKRNTREYKEQKAKEDKKNELVKKMEIECDKLELAANKGAVPESMIFLAHTIKRLIEDGQEKICQKSPEEIIEVFRKYQTSALVNYDSSEENNDTPKDIKELSDGLVGSKVYNETRKAIIEKRLESELAEYGININDLKVMAGGMKGFKDSSAIKVLATIGLCFNSEGEDIKKHMNIVAESESGDVYILYKSQIEGAMRYLGSLEQGCTTHEFVKQKFYIGVNNTDTDNRGVEEKLEKIEIAYNQSKEKNEFNKLPDKEKHRILMEPIDTERDSELMIRWKTEYQAKHPQPPQQPSTPTIPGEGGYPAPGE